MRLLALACVLAACGRLGFGSGARTHDDAPSGSGDAGDAAGAPDARDAMIFDSSIDGPTLCVSQLCDDFEAGISGSWTSDVSAGAIAPATSPVHSGTHSVALTTTMITSSVTNPRSSLERFAPLPFPDGTIYARVWLYLQSPFSTTAYFAQFINFANTAGQGISIGARNGYVTANDYTDGGYMESATTQLPLDRWFCLQMEMPTGSTSTVRAYVDAVEVTDIALTKTTAQPPPDQVYFGFMWVGTISSLPAAAGWMDDVAVGTTPISCN